MESNSVRYLWIITRINLSYATSFAQKGNGAESGVLAKAFS